MNEHEFHIKISVTKIKYELSIVKDNYQKTYNKHIHNNLVNMSN